MESAKLRIQRFLLERVGAVVTAEELREVAGISEWARRVRELRDEDGWRIASHNDSTDLKPGEYRLEEVPSLAANPRRQRSISQRTRAEVLDRDGFTCQMCGLGAGERDPVTGRPVRLHIAHVVDKSLGGSDEPSNLRTFCSTCNQGAKNFTSEKPSVTWLLSQIRRASLDDQRRVLSFLIRKFGLQDDFGKDLDADGSEAS